MIRLNYNKLCIIWRRIMEMGRLVTFNLAGMTFEYDEEKKSKKY